MQRASPPPIPGSGNLRDVPFARLVGHFVRSEETGVIELDRKGGLDKAFFMRGVPQGARTYDNRFPLGDVLVREGHLTAEELEEGIAKHRRDGGLLGQVLVQMGAVTAEALDAAFAKQSHLSFLSFFGVDEAAYEYRTGLVELTDFRPIPMLALATIYRGLRDHASEHTCLQMLGRYAFSRISLSAQGKTLLGQLSPAENGAASHLQEARTTAELAERTKLPRKSLAALLIALDELGGLESTPV